MWATKVAAEAKRLRKSGMRADRAWCQAAGVTMRPYTGGRVVGVGSHRERILDLVADGEPWTSGELAEILGRRAIDVSTLLRKSAAAGQVVIVGTRRRENGGGVPFVVYQIADARLAAK